MLLSTSLVYGKKRMVKGKEGKKATGCREMVRKDGGCSWLVVGGWQEERVAVVR
jgi:hypothetical protein